MHAPSERARMRAWCMRDARVRRVRGLAGTRGWGCRRGAHAEATGK